MEGVKYFLISNSQNPAEFLHPYPLETSKQYIWKEGLVGAAGFYHKEAMIISKDCTPVGNVIPMGDNVIKEN